MRRRSTRKITKPSSSQPFFSKLRSQGDVASPFFSRTTSTPTPIVQAKLTVGEPGDMYEQEADRVAETVMRMPEPDVPEEEETKVQAKPIVNQISPLVQRAPNEQTDEDKTLVQTMPEEVPEQDEQETIAAKPMLQRQTESGVDEEDEPVQTKPSIQRQTNEDDEEPLQTIIGPGFNHYLQRQMEEGEEEAVQAKQFPGQLSTQAPKATRTPANSVSPVIQRVCRECEGEIQRQTEDEEELAQTKRLVNQQFVTRQPSIQPKGVSGQTPQVSPATAANIHSLNGGGSPLPRSARSFFEPRFGADFSQVRVHTGSHAAETAKSINARAFTVGRNIAFGVGQYAPESKKGKRLLGHELTHVLQQNGNKLRQALRPKKSQEMHFTPSLGANMKLEISNGSGPFGSTRTYTSGSHIVFGSGDFQPENKVGQRLHTHELVHVGQQGESTEKPQIFRKEATPSAESTASVCEKYPPEPEPEKEKSETDSADIPDNIPEQKTTAQVAKGKPENTLPKKAKALEPEADQTAENEAGTVEFPKNTKEDAKFQQLIGNTRKAKVSQKRHEDSEIKAEEAKLSAENPDSKKANMVNASKVLTVDEKIKNQESAGFNKKTFKKSVLKLVEKELGKIQENKEGNKAHKETNVKILTKGPSEQISQSQEPHKKILNITDAIPSTESNESLYEKDVKATTKEDPGRKASIKQAERAAPKPVAPEEVALDKEHDADSLDRAMEDERLKELDTKITESQLEDSNESDFTQTLEIKRESQKELCQIPGKLRDKEADAREKAAKGAQMNVNAALKNKHAKRSSSFQDIDKGKTTTKKKDESLLNDYYNEIGGIYESASADVKKTLQNLDECASCLFESAMQEANDTFKEKVTDRLNDYYGEGIFNLSEEGKDWKERKANREIRRKIYWLDLRKKTITDPKEIARIDSDIERISKGHQKTIVEKIFQEEKKIFIATLDTALDEIAGRVEQGLNAAKAIIAKGKKDIKNASERLPQHLQQEAADRTKDFMDRFKDLESTVNEKQKELAQTLAREYAKNVKKLEETFEKIREEAAMSWWEKAKRAIKRIATIIYDLGNLLVKVLVKAASVIGDIIAHPIRFVKNLISAVGDGFNNFVKNISEHLEDIIFKLILGTLPPNIKMPTSWGPKNLFSFALDVLGLTKENIRAQAVDKLGEPVVSKLESTFDLFVLFKKDGFAGLWEHIKEKIGDLKDRVIEGIKDYFKNSIIKAAVKFLLSALTPVSGFIKACETLINIAKFFIQNLKNILQLLDSILDSFVDIARGKLGNAAKKVEDALANILLVGLKFLAALVGINLDTISAKVMKLFNAIRNPVNRAIKWLIGKATAFAHRTGLVKLAQKGRGKIEQGKEWVKEKGVAVLKFFGVKKKFTAANGETHSIYYQQQGSKTVLLVSSSPKSIREFLIFYKDEFGISEDKLDKIRTFISSEIDPLISQLKTAKQEKKKNDIQRELLNKNVDLSAKLRTLLSGDKEVGDEIESYMLEGLVATYGSMPKPVRDILTPDHQPQAAILEWATSQPYFGTTSNMAKRAAGRASNGYAINLHENRHSEGRTFGPKGGKTKSDFVAFVERMIKKKGSAATYQQKREIVVDRIKEELAEDVMAMKAVARRNKKGDVWYDIQVLNISDKEKDGLIETIRSNILNGEDQLSNQDVESLKQ